MEELIELRGHLIETDTAKGLAWPPDARMRLALPLQGAAFDIGAYEFTK